MPQIHSRRGISWDLFHIISYAPTMDWDVNNGSMAFIELSGAGTLNEPTNWDFGQELTLVVKHNGNALTIGSWSGIFWHGGVSEPDISTETASHVKYNFIKINAGGGQIIVARVSDINT